jgi:ketosteroid isomerase-like protein
MWAPSTRGPSVRATPLPRAAAEARGDLAYTVAPERTTASINGTEPKPYVLRVMTIFRREDGEWKVAHRHGDALAADSAAVVGQLTPPAREPAG